MPLADKLAQWQHQAGARTAAAVRSTAGPAAPRAPSSEIDRLRRLLARRPGASPASAATPNPPAHSRQLSAHGDRDLPGIHLAPGLRYVERHIDCESPPVEFMPDMRQPRPVRADRLLCFDTETTGLAGGSGTRAFMIGTADWSDGQLRLRQLYLDAIAGEPAMLSAFAGWLTPDTVLVSYNGRSYDAPLLATRYRLARQSNPLDGLLHVDLLHPVRRRYRGCWDNCRLATVERQLLHVVREDDLPGAEAPAAWLGYLRGGSAANLRRVLGHNSQDLVSLARLLCVLHRPSG